MVTDKGYVKLFRKLLEWEWYDDANTFRLFMHCLMKANYQDKVWHGIKVNRGSFLTSRDKLADELKLSVQNIRTAISHLESTGELTNKPTNKNRIVSVCNYESYQVKKDATNQQANQQLTINQPTTNQQLTTTNKEKNIKNDKKEEVYRKFAHLSLSQKEFEGLIEKGITKIEIDDLCDKIENYKKNTNYKSLNLTIQSWYKLGKKRNADESGDRVVDNLRKNGYIK